MRNRFQGYFLITAVAILCLSCHAQSTFSTPRHDFHGWKAIVVRNRSAEVVMVPEIGRIMQFTLLDQKGSALSGPFWNNPDLRKDMPADIEGWKNFGGDKAWPSPQQEWPSVAGHRWPPPAGFDATPFTADIKNNQVEMISPVDPMYGVRVRRTISLDSDRPVLTVHTVYEKVSGPPVHIGVWTITQLQSPDRAFVLLPERTKFPDRYVRLNPAQPNDLRIDGRVLSFRRDPKTSTQIGTEAETLLWVGNGADLLLELKSSAIGAAAEWPSQGSHSQIYTSGTEMKYVEFELFQPLHMLRAGLSTTLDAVYTLIPRTEGDPLAEAHKAIHY